MTNGWIVAAAAAMVLAGCQDAKKAGPEEQAAGSLPVRAKPVPPVTANPAAAKPLASFAGMDADGDGAVSSAEHARAAQTMFQMMDGDRDGTVTVAEMDAAQAAIGDSRALSSEKKIGLLDADGDAKLTLAEYVAGSNALFAEMDANKDDRLDRAEWDTGQAMRPRPGTAAGVAPRGG